MARSTLVQELRSLLRRARRHGRSPMPASPNLDPAAPVPGVTRRRFVQSSLAAGGAATFAHTLASFPVGVRRTPAVAVVGGGLAGLVAALRLREAGLDATVYEGRHRLGGRVFSATGVVGDGLDVDLGGAFINADHADMLTLARDLGVPLWDRGAAAARSGAPQTAFLFDGRAIPEAEVAAALGPIADVLAEDAAQVDADFLGAGAEIDALSVTDYLDRHASALGEPWVRLLLEQAIRVEYGVEPHESSALQLLALMPRVLGDDVEVLGASDERYVVQGGTSRLVDALADRLRDHVRLGKKLARVAPIDASGARGYELTFEDGETVSADFVVLALPFTALRRVRVDVELPALLREYVSEARLGVNEKLFVGFRERAWRTENGFARDAFADRGFSAAWEETARQPEYERAVLTAFYGADQAREALDVPVREEAQRVVQSFVDAGFGAFDGAANGLALRTRWARDAMSRGSYTSFAPGQWTRFARCLWVEADDAGKRQEVVVGGIAFAGEHLSHEHYGFMNGAAQTGRLAAEAIARLAVRARQSAA